MIPKIFIIKLKRKLMWPLRMKLKFLVLVLFGIISIFVFGKFVIHSNLGKPYYLVENPSYVFIDNDNEIGNLVRPECNPFNNPRKENVKVRVLTKIKRKFLKL